MKTPLHFSSPSPCSAAFFSASSLILFLLPIILSVAVFSISAIFPQLEMRLRVPSTLTTMGPRWSRETVVLPLLMSSVVVLDSEAGRARGALGDREGSGSSVDVEVFEEYMVDDIVNARDAKSGFLWRKKAGA